MYRQRFTRSLRINLSSISLFLFGHFFEFGPGAARTQYLAPDALQLSVFAQWLYQWHTHTHTHTTQTGARHRPSHRSPFAPSCIAGPPTLSLSLGTTAGQRGCESAALRVPALPGFAKLLQYFMILMIFFAFYFQILISLFTTSVLNESRYFKGTSSRV